MHIERTLKATVLSTDAHFKVLLLTGPRQVGKTTLLKSLQTANRSYITLDHLDTRAAAKEDPAGFIQNLTLPVLIDEVQYAPELFPYIKMKVDESDQKGLFWLTGSQQYAMMQHVTESLAGRVGIIQLQGISLAEDEGRPATPPFVPTVAILQQRAQLAQSLSLQILYQKIWRGSYPQVVSDQGASWERFYESYIQSYVERDARDYMKIDDLVAFRKFIQMAAARTGQMLNYREIANDVGISEPTIKSWFGVLQATGLIVMLEPYHNNLTKRLRKTPKFYFMDTGLCCFLTRWTSPEVLEGGAMAGAILETYVVSEIIKSHIHNGRSPHFYYYADKDKREVDLLIEQDGQIHPIEIKKSASIYNTSFKGFGYLEALKKPIGHGCVLCFHDSLMPYKKDIHLVPIGYL